MTQLSRRRLLGSVAATAAGAGLASTLPPSLHRAMAAPTRPGGLKAVEHVVVLMQENRSFDHYFGTMRGVRGYGDRTPLRLPSGRPLSHQPRPGGGEVLPFSVREGAERAHRDPSDIQYLGALDHSWPGSTKAWARGWYDDWVAAKTEATMAYYERRDIPLQYELADTFTLCDAYHCSVFGSTNPNRNYLWSGKVGFEPGTTQRAVTNAAYDYDHPGYEWTTYPERLEAAGVPWQIYQEWDNFTDNAVEYFRPFKQVGTKALTAVDEKFRTTEELYFALFDRPEAERRRLLDQLAAGRAGLTPAERSLFDRALYRSEPESLVPRLRADIAAGRLPKVSWLVPSAVDSEHPGSSTPVGSANLIYDVLDALAEDVDTWSRTVLFVNFDENDGYFDHVPPPVPPRPASGNGEDWYDGQPIGLGPRVPMTVVSPWTIGGHVDSEVFDHTSVLRFLERWTGVREPNISTWRRTVCGDLTSAFDFGRQGRAPRLDHPGPVPAPIDRWHPQPPTDQSVPPQEPGHRPARALPYRPAVSTRLEGGGRLALTLTNDGTASAHFAIYPYAGEFDRPRHLDVHGNHVERVQVSGGRYRLGVQGPNRFWYELAGTVAGSAAGVDVRVAAPVGGLQLRLQVSNASGTAVTLRLRALDHGDADRTLRLSARQRRMLEWPTDDGWYDIEVQAAEDPTFRRRLAGRVEDGRAGRTA
ncbi:phosphocholine-specific phospholipase C [Actinopolymorpha singaporensis]|uniref:phospholipase C n=1 Tax=Actinopolymorpha singaporensis TaxID=117157 RepID=A0A1H1MD08_9ACTN|nr:phospholipase C, phosphocholine-specific [Actinopolymorpha singaporensis]SDR84683.1 phospholipase C [Actinopolymorpha singaporensis]